MIRAPANYALDFSDATMTGTATLTSDPIDLLNCSGCSITVVWTGTAVGTFSIQCSNDAGALTDRSDPGSASITNWDTIDSEGISAAGSLTWNIDAQFGRWLRWSYTNTSSTGTITSSRTTKKDA